MKARRTAILVVVGAVWTSSLFMRAHAYYPQAHYARPAGSEIYPGLALFLFGWCPIFVRDIAWFANIALGFSLRRSCQGIAGPALALLACAMATSVFRPIGVWNEEGGGFDPAWFGGPAVWTWLGALGLNAILQLAFAPWSRLNEA